MIADKLNGNYTPSAGDSQEVLVNYDDLARDFIIQAKSGELPYDRPDSFGDTWNKLILEEIERPILGYDGMTGEQKREEATKLINNLCSFKPKLKELLEAKPEQEDDDGIQIISNIADMPPLPEGVRVPLGGSKGACPWHDEFVAFSKHRSPRSFHNFHESNGWALLSAVAMHRVRLDLGSKRYTPLFIANIASSSVSAKSEAAKVFLAVLGKAGLKWVLGPDNTTPQAMIGSMATVTELKDDSNYSKWKEEEKAEYIHKLAFRGQRGWFYEEFGEQMEAMCQTNGIMSDFRGIIRRMDDCYDEYSRDTITHKIQIVEFPYLSLIACMTPLDIKVQAGANSAFWRDGFFARFAFIVPTETGINRARFPAGSIWENVPDALTYPLQGWNTWLGTRKVIIEPEYDGDKIKRYPVTYGEFPERICTLTKEAEDAFYRYGDALDDIMYTSSIKQFEGNYKRLPMMAMRIAMICASLCNNGVIEMKHWWKGQEFAEMARQGLHSIYAQINITIDLQQVKPTIADKILSYMKEQKKEGNFFFSIRDIARGPVRGVDGDKIKREMDVLLRDDIVKRAETKNKQGRKVERYRLS